MSCSKNDLEVANDLLRSAYAIAERDGKDTNWEAFRKKLGPVLQRQNQILNGSGYFPAASCTPKIFHLPSDVREVVQETEKQKGDL